MSLQHYVNSEFLPTCAIAREALLTAYSDSAVEKVLVLTSDSRTLVGTLLSCDQMTNLVFPPFSSSYLSLINERGMLMVNGRS
jgi:hypothetical protein